MVRKRASLVSRGAWARFVMSICLVSVIPALAIILMLSEPLAVDEMARPLKFGIVAAILMLVFLGYALLIRYPQTTVILRRNLKRIASGELPDGVLLARDENDIVAIEKYLNAILDHARWKVATIEKQREDLLHAERQRVMIESLGATCHHIGQPVTTLTMQLELLKRTAVKKDQRAGIDECIATVEAMGKILHRLQEASHYRTEPYLNTEKEIPAMDDRIILL